MLACLCTNLAESPGGPPCFCGLVPGQQVALDFCDCSSSTTDCGMAWVRAGQRFPDHPVPEPADRADLLRGPDRCPGRDGRHPLCARAGRERNDHPGEEAQYEAVRVQMGDMAAMRRALDCCLALNRRDWVLGPYVAVGPSGGCAGGAFQVTVRL